MATHGTNPAAAAASRVSDKKKVLTWLLTLVFLTGLDDFHFLISIWSPGGHWLSGSSCFFAGSFSTDLEIRSGATFSHLQEALVVVGLVVAAAHRLELSWAFSGTRIFCKNHMNYFNIASRAAARILKRISWIRKALLINDLPSGSGLGKTTELSLLQGPFLTTLIWLLVRHSSSFFRHSLL